MLTKSMDYVLTVYEYIADKGDVVNTLELHGKTGISRHYLEQICRKLRVAGFIHSLRGPGGGYTTTENLPSALELCNLMTVGRGSKFVPTSKCAKAMVEFAGELTIGRTTPHMRTENLENVGAH